MKKFRKYYLQGKMTAIKIFQFSPITVFFCCGWGKSTICITKYSIEHLKYVWINLVRNVQAVKMISFENGNQIKVFTWIEAIKTAIKFYRHFGFPQRKYVKIYIFKLAHFYKLSLLNIANKHKLVLGDNKDNIV